MSVSSLEFNRGPEGRQTFSRKREEFVADFCLVSRRILDDAEHQIFRYFFLLGADWRLCTRQLKIERGNFFHTIYRIQQKLGREFAALEPYALYPVAEYFSSVIGQPAAPSRPVMKLRNRGVRQLPLPLSA